MGVKRKRRCWPSRRAIARAATLISGPPAHGRAFAARFRARDDMEAVSREELLDRLRCGAVTLIDVRPEDEFAHGHLPGALNIPLGRLELRLAELPPDREVVAYCRGPWCVLSFEAVALLRRRGHLARRLEDGFPEWKVAGLPVESAQ